MNGETYQQMVLSARDYLAAGVTESNNFNNSVFYCNCAAKFGHADWGATVERVQQLWKNTLNEFERTVKDRPAEAAP